MKIKAETTAKLNAISGSHISASAATHWKRHFESRRLPPTSLSALEEVDLAKTPFFSGRLSAKTLTSISNYVQMAFMRQWRVNSSITRKDVGGAWRERQSSHASFMMPNSESLRKVGLRGDPHPLGSCRAAWR